MVTTFKRRLQVGLGILKSVLEKAFYILLLEVLECTVSIVVNCILYLFEELLEVNNITEVLAFIFVVWTVNSADGLEQVVTFHLLVEIEICCAWSVEAGKEFVDHDEQLHLTGMVDELVFGPFLILFSGLVSKHPFGKDSLLLGFAFGFI